MSSAIAPAPMPSANAVSATSGSGVGGSNGCFGVFNSLTVVTEDTPGKSTIAARSRLAGSRAVAR